MCLSSNEHECLRAERNAPFDLFAMSLSQLLTNSGMLWLCDSAVVWLATYWWLIKPWLCLQSQPPRSRRSTMSRSASTGFVLWIRIELIRAMAKLPARRSTADGDAMGRPIGSHFG